MTEAEDLKVQDRWPTSFVPSPYRQVSVQPYAGALDDHSLIEHLLGREAYRKTRFVILEADSGCAVAAVVRDAEEPLFSPIRHAELVASAAQCVWCNDPEIDTAMASALAATAKRLGVGPEQTLVVRGRDGHVNFIHRPEPVQVTVFDVVPPAPPKLAWMAQHVLTFADLPAIELTVESLDLRDLAREADAADRYLVPCRASGLELDRPTHFLDERPPRADWTLLGCHRSRQIHRHFYGDEPPCVEMCPRLRAPDDGARRLMKCCLLDDRIEVTGRQAVIPWGGSLRHVERALTALTADEGDC